MAKGKVTTKKPKGTLVTREVELELDDKILVKLGKERGDKLRAKADLEEKAAEDKQKWAERIKPLSERLTFIDDCLRNGKEKKTLEVTAVKNYDENKVEFWYEGKIVDYRAMTVQDRQEDMPLKTKKGRSKENSVKNVAPQTEEESIAEVRKLETSKRTKLSAVDGPTKPNGLDGVYGGSGS